MHTPVMLEEVLAALELKPNGIYLDLTLGRGGHAAALLAALPAGQLIGLDKDQEAIAKSRQRLEQTGATNFLLIHRDFRELEAVLAALNVRAVDGILADLGVSSPQIDTPERGFSYSKDGVLDMRMDQRQPLTAWDIVNTWSAPQLAAVFQNYADVKSPHRIANAIVNQRPIATTGHLATIIKAALPARMLRVKNPLRPVFQALRIAVNDEFGALRALLEVAPALLKPQGVLAIISFHSLEDQLVKRAFGQLVKPQIDPKIPVQERLQFRAQTRYPTAAEVAANRRARSAKLRVLKRLY